MRRSNLITLAIATLAIFLIGAIYYSNLNKSEDSGLANFEITIQTTESGVKLTCSKGCAWKELSYSRTGQNNIQKFDEYGMVTDSSKK